MATTILTVWTTSVDCERNCLMNTTLGDKKWGMYSIVCEEKQSLYQLDRITQQCEADQDNIIIPDHMISMLLISLLRERTICIQRD